jgi:hypothetical protein
VKRIEDKLDALILRVNIALAVGAAAVALLLFLLQRYFDRLIELLTAK